MRCTNCGAPAKGKRCEYCGAVVINEAKTTKATKTTGKWPVMLFIYDEYEDAETGVFKTDYFAFDIATDCETDTITGKEACLNDLKSQIQKYINEEPVNIPTEQEVLNNKYSKKLIKNFKYEIVYLDI